MKWEGYICVSDVPLGARQPPIDDPRYLSKKLSDQVYELTGLYEEKEILIQDLERFINDHHPRRTGRRG